MALTTTPSELTATALTLTTAAQPNITSVGTLSALTVSGNLNATLTTAAQPNITSVGTLTGLTGGTGDLIWDTNTLVVDSSANKVGIGTTSPSYKLSLSDASGPDIQLHRADTTIADADSYGQLLWSGDDSDSNANGIRGFIKGVAQGAGGGMKMQFGTAGGGVAIGTARMTLNADGQLGIGTASPAYETQIYSADDTVLSVVSGDSSSASLYLGDGVATRGRLTYNNNGDYLAIYTDNNERIRIDSTGKVGIGTTSPGAPLNVTSAYSSGNITTSLKLATVGGYASNTGTALDFGSDQGNYATWITGRIASPRTGSNWGGSLVFSVNNDSAADNATEAMRIDTTGKVSIKNSGTDKVARFINTGSGTQGITVGTTTADNAGKGLHLAHDNSSTAYVHAYNYAGASYDNLELRGNTVSAVGGTGHNVIRACANGLFSIGAATYTQGKIRQFNYTASISNGTTVDLFYNTGAYDDLHLILTMEATHSSRTYRWRSGPFGYYQSLPQLNAGVGLDFSQATVNTGRRMIQITNSSGYTAATYISALIFGDNGVTVSNGIISDLI